MKKVSVECRNISLSYGNTDVLTDINLRVEPGEFFALLGPSGSGKSTLLRLIAGFNRHRSGQLLIDGNDLTAIPPHRRNIGMVFQNYALWPHMTVWNNVAFGLVERKVNGAELKSRVQAALDLVGLGSYGKRYPAELSGGQQQRVALARTLVIEPQVLLLDEPLSNLDRNLRVQMRRELLSLQRRLGITTIFVTHDQEEAMTTADRMAILNRGVVQQVGTPADIFDYPENLFVARFVGTMNVLRATLHQQGDRWMMQAEGVGEIPLPAAPKATDGRAMAAGFRPHALHLAAVPNPQLEGVAWMHGVVERSEFLGEFTRYDIRVGSQLVTVDQPHHAGMRLQDAGTALAVGLPTSQIRWLPLIE